MPKKCPFPSLLLVLSLVFQLLFGPQIVLGAQPIPSDSNQNPPQTAATISLEQAVQIVKEAFPIPKQFTRFSSGFNEDYTGRSSYSLNWNSSEEPYGNMSAQVDAESGTILSMNIWENKREPNSAFQLPVLSRSEAKDIALATVNKLAKEYASELKLIEDNEELLSFNRYEPYRYNFRWIRMVNDIPFPTNSLTVGIRGDTGQVVNYYHNWTRGIEPPAATSIVSLEQAQEVFRKTPMLELQYFMPYPRNPEERSLPVILVYQLKSEYYGGSIDALTGKPLSQGDYGPVGKAGNSTLNVETTSNIKTIQANSEIFAASKSEVISNSMNFPDVNPKVKISKEEAEALVKKFIDVPSNLTLRGINLNPDWRDKTKQVWNLDWNAEPTSQDNFQYLNARIDANSGELISFNLGEPNRQGVPNIDRQEAQTLAGNFLKEVSSSRINELRANQNDYWSKTETIGYFNYTRLVNGIPFPRNSVSIGVDMVNKRIINYNSEWTTANFPSPSQALGLDKAIDLFLKERPLELNYIQIYKPAGEYEIRLVYQPRVPYGYPGAQMISATTGEPLDYEGRTKGQWPRPYRFSDIDGLDAQKEIEILGQIGAFGEFGETFKPEAKVKASALLRALLVSRFGAWEKASLIDEGVIKEAKAQGWISEEIDPSAELSRLDLSRIMVRLIGMEAAAQVPGIYHLSFKDVASVPSDSMGYLALSWGLGLIKGDGWYLKADDKVTRAEAAYALVQALRVYKQPLQVMPY